MDGMEKIRREREIKGRRQAPHGLEVGEEPLDIGAEHAPVALEIVIGSIMGAQRGKRELSPQRLLLNRGHRPEIGLHQRDQPVDRIGRR
jgi:hypothetical protein